MPHPPIPVPADQVELLGDAALTLDQLAVCCRVTPEWVINRVEAGVLQVARGGQTAQWRFASTTVMRARRIIQLERTYDADPQLAALTADLIEEVTRLRRAAGGA